MPKQELSPGQVSRVGGPKKFCIKTDVPYADAKRIGRTE